MRVQLDLRPRHVVEAQSRRLNLARVLLSVLFVAFLLVTGSTLVLSFLKVRGMDAEITMLKDQVTLQKAQTLKMGNEIKRLAGEENMYASALSLLHEDLPALEFLESVEKFLPEGVWLTSLTMSPGSLSVEKGKPAVPDRVTLRGGAYVENDVVEFAKGLQGSWVVLAVDFPVTSRVEKKEESDSIVDFTLSCTLRDAGIGTESSQLQGRGAP